MTVSLELLHEELRASGFRSPKGGNECAAKRSVLTPRGVTTAALFGKYMVAGSQPDEGLNLDINLSALTTLFQPYVR